MTSQNDPLAKSHLTLVSVCATLGFSCVICWNLSMLFSPALPLFLETAIVLQITAMIVAFFSCAVLSIVVRRFADSLYRNRTVFFSIACLLSIPAAFVLYLGRGMVFLMPAGGLLIIWAVFGLSYAGGRLGWILFLSTIPTRNTLIIVACSSIIGTLLFLMISLTDDPLLGLYMLSFGALASAALLFLLLNISKAQTVEPVNPVEENKGKPLHTLKKIFSSCVHGGVYGIVASLLFTFDAHTVITAVAWGIVGGVGSLIFSRYISKLSVDALIIQRITLVPIVTSLFMIPLLNSTGQIVCCCVFNASHAFYRTTDFGIMAAANFELRLNSLRRSTLSLTSHQFGLGLGLLVGLFVYFLPLMDSHATNYIFGIVVVLLLTATVFDGLTKPKSDSESAQEAQESVRDLNAYDLHERSIGAISEKYALSPREKEVFSYLARGRNARYIQDKLFLATGTVKTHIAHIYNKLGINSQQQLMDMIEGVSDED